MFNHQRVSDITWGYKRSNIDTLGMIIIYGKSMEIQCQCINPMYQPGATLHWDWGFVQHKTGDLASRYGLKMLHDHQNSPNKEATNLMNDIHMSVRNVNALVNYWLVVWNMFIFPHNYWECHHTNWRTRISQRGRAQPPTISMDYA